MPKKNDTLRFILDLQPVNKVTIRNARIRPTIDEFAEAFAGRSIYSVDADSSLPSANVYPSARRDELGSAHGECNE